MQVIAQNVTDSQCEFLMWFLTIFYHAGMFNSSCFVTHGMPVLASVSFIQQACILNLGQPLPSCFCAWSDPMFRFPGTGH